MTGPQDAVVYGLALAFYGVALVFLLLGTCDLWLDLRDRLASRRRKRPDRQLEDWRRSFNHENTNAPSGSPPLRLGRSGDPAKPQFPPPQVIQEGLQLRRPTRDDSLDAADVLSYLRWRNQRLQRALMDDPTHPEENHDRRH